MLINFSNHPSALWGQKQLEAAREYGEVKDMPFPKVSPEAGHDEIQALAEHYVAEIQTLAETHRLVVHVMGEMTFTFLVVSRLKAAGIECVASTTEREAELTADGKKISEFRFVRFRKY